MEHFYTEYLKLHTRNKPWLYSIALQLSCIYNICYM